MMMEEFEKMTGVSPLPDEYQEIEEAYYASGKTKQEFCKQFLKQGGIGNLMDGRARTISVLKRKLLEEKTEYDKQTEQLSCRIEKLQKDLDRELDWKPSKCGTRLSQKEYLELEGAADGLSDEAAKDLVHLKFGFDPDMVQIVPSVHTYEVNKYHRLRIQETFKRFPLYFASDWNYIRFDCMGMQYEIINGSLTVMD